MDDLHYLSATEARRMFRDHKLSPVELLQALIDRAEKVEPSINAFAETHYDTALQEARASAAADYDRPDPDRVGHPGLGR